jgi:ABC-type Na+ efflux pump permease subunit
MRVLFAMVGKDLRRRLRSPLPTILLLLFPVIFSGLLAVTFGGGEPKVPKVHLLIEDHDGEVVSQLVIAAFQRGEAQKYFEVKKVEIPKDPAALASAASLLEKEGATALLRLPAGFSEAVFKGRPAQIELVKSPAQSILPDVAEQVTTVLAEALSSASRLLRVPLDRMGSTPVTPEGNASDQQVAEISVQINQVVTRARPYVLPPVIKLETATRREPDSGKKAPGPAPAFTIFLFILPGISVYALFNLADQTMRDLLVEARLKTLRRQLAGPVTAGRVLIGKALSTAAVATVALLLLAAVGAVVAPRRVSLGGFVLLSFALVLATTGFASAVFGAASGERQGATLASLLSLVMAFAGGSFIPLDNLPPALRAVSPFSLMYWGNVGYQKLVIDGAGLGAVLPHVAVLGGTGVFLLALSAPLWRRRLLRGDLA